MEGDLVFRDADPSEDDELARIMYNAFLPIWYITPRFFTFYTPLHLFPLHFLFSIKIVTAFIPNLPTLKSYTSPPPPESSSTQTPRPPNSPHSILLYTTVLISKTGTTTGFNASPPL